MFLWDQDPAGWSIADYCYFRHMLRSLAYQPTNASGGLCIRSKAIGAFCVTLTDVDKVARPDIEERDDEIIVVYHHRRRRQLAPSMRCSTTCYFLAFSTSCAIASPYLKYRQLAACADPEAPLLKPCWNVLDIPDYLSEWQKNVAVCPELEYTNGCCILGEPWSSCFLRLGWEKAPSGCLGVSETDLEACQFPTGTVRSDIPRDTVQKVKYVTANIVNIHRLFQSLYQCKLITLVWKVIDEIR